MWESQHWLRLYGTAERPNFLHDPAAGGRHPAQADRLATSLQPAPSTRRLDGRRLSLAVDNNRGGAITAGCRMQTGSSTPRVEVQRSIDEDGQSIQPEKTIVTSVIRSKQQPLFHGAFCWWVTVHHSSNTSRLSSFRARAARTR